MDTGKGGLIRAPIPGKLVLLKAEVGRKIRKGDELAVMEAMKMEMSIKAVADGIITDVLAEPGSILDADAAILSWEPCDA